MGRIPLNLDNKTVVGTQPIQSQQGFNVNNINRVGAGNVEVGRALERFGTGVERLGYRATASAKAESRRSANVDVRADLAKYEQQYEVLDNQRQSAIAKTRDVVEIKKINKRFFADAEALLKPTYTTADGVPLFRSGESHAIARNNWLRNQGNVKHANMLYLQEIDKRATYKRVEASTIQAITTPRYGYDDLLTSEDTIRENAETLVDGGYLSEDEAAAKVQDDIARMKDSAVVNRIALIDTTTKTAIGAESAVEDLKDALQGDSDYTEKQKARFFRMADDVVKRKKTNERANANEAKQRKYELWKQSADSVLSEMRDDGSLPLTNEQLRANVDDGKVDPKFAAKIISARARNDLASAKAAKIKEYKEAKLSEKLKLDQDFDELFSKVSNFDPTADPSKRNEHVAGLWTDIARYSGTKATVLAAALRDSLSLDKASTTVEERALRKRNAVTYKTAIDDIKTRLGVAKGDKKGKNRPPKYESHFLGTSYGNTPYTDRLAIFQSIQADIYEHAGRLPPQELIKYVHELPAYKKLVDQGVSEEFFRAYNATPAFTPIPDMQSGKGVTTMGDLRTRARKLQGMEDVPSRGLIDTIAGSIGAREVVPDVGAIRANAEVNRIRNLSGEAVEEAVSGLNDVGTKIIDGYKYTYDLSSGKIIKREKTD